MLRHPWADFAWRRLKVQRQTNNHSPTGSSEGRVTYPTPPSTAPRSPGNVTATRHSLPHLCGERKPLGFTPQCTFDMPARAASLLEKQIVTNPATLLSANDPKAEGSPEILLTLQRFFPITGAGGISLAESSQKAHTAKRPTATEVKSSPCRFSFQFPGMSNPNMLQVYFLNQKVFLLSVSPLAEWLSHPSEMGIRTCWENLLFTSTLRAVLQVQCPVRGKGLFVWSDIKHHVKTCCV